MKKFNLILAACIAVFAITGNSYAFFNVVPLPIENKALVKVTVPTDQKSSLSLSDTRGNVIHYENIKAGNTNSRTYDLTNLNNGIYTFYSAAEFNTTIKEVKIEDSRVSVISKVVEFKPFFKTEQERLMINYLNDGEEEIELVIETGDKVFYDGKVGNDVNFQKVVNISKLDRGEYYAMLKVGAKTYGHTFFVD